MYFFGRLVFALLCALGTFGYGKAALGFAYHHLVNTRLLTAFIVGCVFYTILWIFVFSKREKFWSVVEHEMTHALFALIFFKKVHSFSASRIEGGKVEIEGENFMIALSPYFFPLLTVIIIVIKPSIISQYQWILNGLMGFTLTFHLVHLTREFHPYQPDLRKSGMIFSVAVVLFFNIFFIGLAISSLAGNWLDMKNYMEIGFRESFFFLPGH